MSKPMFVPVPPHVDGDALFAAAERLEARLHARLPELKAELAKLPAPDGLPGYWGDWFVKKMPNVLSYLQVYGYILGQALPDVPLKDVRVLDYGGGWGLLGLLAKEAGAGSVTYLDINEGTARAVQTISAVLDLPLASVICGDESALHGMGERFNSVVSSDVLEHVYDPDRVFAAIAGVCEPGARVFHQTGANPRSLHQQVTLRRLHQMVEPDLYAKRREVIAAAGVAAPDVDRLAVATRGLDHAGLDAAIAAFKASGAVPTPDHPTNTCELNGYWYERLMEPEAVAAKMSAAGFRADVARCFWGPGRSGRAARAVKTGFNAVSRLSRRLGLRATYYYGVAGVRL